MQQFFVGLVRVGLLHAAGLCISSSLAFAAEKPLDFNREVKPILSNKCFFCHGPDEAERKGGTDGLRLDTAEGATADLGGHAAIVPGNPSKSELFARITTDDADLAMPPRETGKQLTAEEIAILKKWIEQGAKYSQHWSYVPPQRPAVPAVKNNAWPKNDVDRFLLARLEQESLAPSAEADKYALIRRVTLDLTGLPPTLEEVDAFLNDKTEQAYEKLIDRLLAKPAFGEHFARDWLDLARYADSAGYADDPPRNIWLFRDYVIRSINANKPFDQFTIEQIAGDLLPDPTDEQIIATAFHRNTLTNNEGGTNDEEFRNVAVVDRVNTTFAVWMGTTIACAQCHTHKYDPITQEEFFRVFAIFNNSEDADRRDESPLFTQLTTEQREQQKHLQQDLAWLEEQLKKPTPELEEAQQVWEAKFPRQLAWQTLRPEKFESTAGLQGKVADDGTVLINETAADDRYTLEIPVKDQGSLRALRLSTLPSEMLPGKGAGHGGGNFVVTNILAEIVPANSPAASQGRYIRVELPGNGKILSLAEVEVFRGTENIARQGKATQSSTDYEGAAGRAIDGNSNGNYFESNSVTHSAVSDNPWWEVDLQSEQPIERIVLWNRSDGEVGKRLADFRVSVLNEKRETVWQQDIAQPPSPSTPLSPSGRRSITFTKALADYEQNGFSAATVIDADDAKKPKGKKERGWAVGGKTNERHELTLIAAESVPLPAGSKIVVSIEQGSKHPNHTLGHFQLSATADVAVEEYVKTPANVLAALQVEAAARTGEQKQTITQYFLSFTPALEQTRKELAAAQKKLTEFKPESVPVMRELPKAKQRVTKLQHRGNFLDLGQEVSPGIPEAFGTFPAEVMPDRLALAKWLLDERNPLTARVVANRFWEQIFGIGIVSTSEEFGNQGDLPFHPELLDWLATELVRLKWDTKAFLKMLVMTAAYRQASNVTLALNERDPDNRLLARGPRFRLSAEMVRDQALAVGGLLSNKMYGPPVKPPQPAIGLSAAFGGGIDWQTSSGEDKYRRGLYTTWRRSNPYPSMATFDAPNREVCTLRRSRTNTPLQALVTLNDPVYLEAAQALARRMAKEGGMSPSERATYGFRLVLTRPPHEAEAARLVALFEQARQRFEKEPDKAMKLATEPLGALPAGMNATELAAWTLVGNVLLNLDETVMKR